MTKRAMVGVFPAVVAVSVLVVVWLLWGSDGSARVEGDAARVGGGATHEPSPAAVPKGAQKCSPELTSPVPRGFPPPAVLMAGDVCQTGRIGTNCWEWGCGDVVGILVPATPIRVARGQPLRVMLDFDAFDTHVSIWQANLDRLLEAESDDTLVWRALTDVDQVWEGTPPAGRAIELRPDLPPGRYVIEVFTYKVPPGGLQTPGPYGGAAVGGDVSYGFHITAE